MVVSAVELMKPGFLSSYNLQFCLFTSDKMRALLQIFLSLKNAFLLCGFSVVHQEISNLPHSSDSNSGISSLKDQLTQGNLLRVSLLNLTEIGQRFKNTGEEREVKLRLQTQRHKGRGSLISPGSCAKQYVFISRKQKRSVSYYPSPFNFN